MEDRQITNLNTEGNGDMKMVRAVSFIVVMWLVQAGFQPGAARCEEPTQVPANYPNTWLKTGWNK
jgi:hypothetical protein